MSRLVWTLPDGQQTARWAEDEGGGGSSLLLSQPFTMSAQDIKDSTLTPHTIVEAQGAGTLIVPTVYTVLFTAGGTPFNAGALDLVYGEANLSTLFAHLLEASFAGWTIGANASGVFNGYSEGGDPADYLDKPVRFSASLRGAIVGPVTIANNGSDYVVGDTGTVDDGSPNATYEVTADNGFGGVTAVTITDGGDGYARGEGGAPTTWTTTAGGSQPGIGTGLEINVSEVDASASAGDGTLSGVIYYLVADLS